MAWPSTHFDLWPLYTAWQTTHSEDGNQNCVKIVAWIAQYTPSFKQAFKAEPSNILILLNALKIRERLTHIFGMFGQSVLSLYRLWVEKKKKKTSKFPYVVISKTHYRRMLLSEGPAWGAPLASYFVLLQDWSLASRLKKHLLYMKMLFKVNDM